MLLLSLSLCDIESCGASWSFTLSNHLFFSWPVIIFYSMCASVCCDQASAGNSCHDSSAHARPPDDVQHVGKYRLIKTIGRGNFAKVKMAKHVPTGRQVMKCKCHWCHRMQLLLVCSLKFSLLPGDLRLRIFSDEV